MNQTLIHNAKRLEIFLDDDVVRGAFDEIEQSCITRWRTSETLEARELAHSDLRAHDRLRKAFQSIVDRGTRAAHEERRTEPLP